MAEKRGAAGEVKRAPVTEHDVELARITATATAIGEKHRTYRTAIISSASVAGVAITAIAIVKALTPAWVQIVETCVIAIGGPAGILAVALRVYAKHVERSSRRIAELEREKDPERSSSALPMTTLPTITEEGADRALVHPSAEQPTVDRKNNNV